MPRERLIADKKRTSLGTPRSKGPGKAVATCVYSHVLLGRVAAGKRELNRKPTGYEAGLAAINCLPFCSAAAALLLFPALR